jgi:DNA-binding MarR family transcriptional regulator
VAPNVISSLEATVHRVLERLAADLADLGLSQSEVNVLAQLKAGSRMTVSELQAATGQRASTLTGILDRLERRGLLERHPNKHDRRSFTVELTADGAGVAGRIRRTFTALHRRALAGVSSGAAEGFFEVLDALNTLPDRR